MFTNDDNQVIPEEEVAKESSDEEDKNEQGKPTDEEKDYVKNPDLEDPNLYSPLQEPDRPDKKLRASEEEPQSENSLE